MIVTISNVSDYCIHDRTMHHIAEIFEHTFSWRVLPWRLVQEPRLLLLRVQHRRDVVCRRVCLQEPERPLGIYRGVDGAGLHHMSVETNRKFCGLTHGMGWNEDQLGLQFIIVILWLSLCHDLNIFIEM